MKKPLTLIYSIILALVVVISVMVITICSPSIFASSYDDISIQQPKAQTYTVYIGGAVQNEGYYLCKEGDTYYDLLSRAGILDCSYCPTSYYNQYNFDDIFFIVNYYKDNHLQFCINANGIFFEEFTSQYGITKAEIVQCQEGGVFTSKQQLRELFGVNYDEVHYMLYIGES